LTLQKEHEIESHRTSSRPELTQPTMQEYNTILFPLH